MSRVGHRVRVSVTRHKPAFALVPKPELGNQRFNVKKLVDFDAAAFRMRVGNYRVLFDREDGLKIIDIIDILQRKQAYQKR